MATKPLTQPEAWCTNGVYTTGPFIGQPGRVVPPIGVAAEGHRPGSLFPTAAEHENSQQNRLTALARWLFLGSFNPDPDAHVVETNAGGRAGLFGLDVTNTNDESAVTVTGNAAVNFPVVSVTGTGGSTLVQADPGNSAAVDYVALVKAGAAVGFLASMQGSPAAARGMRITADATTAGTGLEVAHDGTGPTATFTSAGQPTGLNAVTITATGVGNNARALDVRGIGVIESLRVRSSDSLGVSAILATLSNTGNTTGNAVRAQTNALATAQSRAVRAEALGSATGVEGIAASGFGGQFSATNAAGAALNIPGRPADPGNAFDGRRDFNTTSRTHIVGDSVGGFWRDEWTSRGGLTIGAGTGGTVTSNGAWVTAVTLQLLDTDAPRRGGRQVVLCFTCDARTLGAVPNTVNVRIFDATDDNVNPIPGAVRSGVGVGPTAGFALPGVSTGWERTIVWNFVYTVPAAGDRTFRVEVQTATATSIQVRDGHLHPYGQF